MIECNLQRLIRAKNPSVYWLPPFFVVLGTILSGMFSLRLIAGIFKQLAIVTARRLDVNQYTPNACDKETRAIQSH